MKRGVILAACALMLFLAACRVESTTPLVVFIAGSLVTPFDAVEEAYEELHPEIDLQIHAHGSVQVIRYVTEIHDLIDVVIPADYTLIPMLMYTNTVPETGEPYAQWYIQFASNRMVLAFTDKSQYGDEITSENWYEVLSRSDVRLGMSDPRLDPAGYRTLMLAQLAESHYQDPTIFERLFTGQFSEPLQIQKVEGVSVIHVPELLDKSQNGRIYLRSGSVALLALLTSGEVDYAFEYASVAQQHGLKTIELPPELNLGDPDYQSNYQTVRVVMDFQRFSSIEPKFPGTVTYYGVTIPSNAPHPDAAVNFVEFLLSPTGKELLTSNYQPVFDHPVSDHLDALPPAL